jgi:hypothetical protein
MRFKFKPFLGALVSVIVTLVIADFLVGRLDPWGLHYLDDLRVLYNGYIADDVRGYRLQDGSYAFRNWTATITHGTRNIPDTGAADDCTLIMLGDSVTFGQGISDDQNWVNLVARALPAVQIINTGVPGYSSTNILGSYQAFPDADAYIYLIAGNDSDPAFSITELKQQAELFGYRPWLVRYMAYILRDAHSGQAGSATDETPDRSRFYSELDQLISDERMTLVGLLNDPNPLAEAVIEHGYAIKTIEYWTHFISRVDGHANVEGNQQIADQMIPIAEEVTGQLCQPT